jgi:hypothetical protein
MNKGFERMICRAMLAMLGWIFDFWMTVINHLVFLPTLLKKISTQGQPQHCSKACPAISSSLDTSRQ